VDVWNAGGSAKVKVLDRNITVSYRVSKAVMLTRTWDPRPRAKTDDTRLSLSQGLKLSRPKVKD